MCIRDSVVGGYVRDIFLARPSKDIDVVVVGSGIEMAQALGKKLGRGAHAVSYTHLDVYKRQSHFTTSGFVSHTNRCPSKSPTKYIVPLPP